MYLCPALRGIQAYSQRVRLRWVHPLFLLPVCPDPAKVFPPLTLPDSGDTIVGRQVWRGVLSDRQEVVAEGVPSPKTIQPGDVSFVDHSGVTHLKLSVIVISKDFRWFLKGIYLPAVIIGSSLFRSHPA